MRTTVRLDDHLLAEAKKLAAESHVQLATIIEDALREALARRTRPSPRRRIRLPVTGGRGLQPGVDLDNSAALRDVMDGL